MQLSSLALHSEKRSSHTCEGVSMDKVQRILRDLSDAALERGAPLDWFEDLYEFADKDRTMIPWSKGEPHPFLVDWMEQHSTQPIGSALIVGCGLGEDAVYLAEKGWKVTGFDLSESAISWVKEMHPHQSITWEVGDLLNPKSHWMQQFDLVLEVHILQAIPQEFRIPASKNLAPLVGQNGTLICIGRMTDSSKDIQIDGPPWPLEISFIESLGQQLIPINMYSTQYDGEEHLRFRAVWKRS